MIHINAAHFLPSEFELEYSVNAEQIGEGFKPQIAEVLVTSDGRNTGIVPSTGFAKTFGQPFLGRGLGDIGIVRHRDRAARRGIRSKRFNRHSM